MPPIAFVGASAAVMIGAFEFAIATPTNARVGDTMFLIASGSGIEIIDDEALEISTQWTYVEKVVAGGWTFQLLRREVTEDEPSSHGGLFFDDVIPAHAAIVVFRGVGADTPLAGAGANDAGSTVHAIPAQNLPVYSSMYLGMIGLTGTIAGVTPAGNTALLANDAFGMIGVFYALPEAPGAVSLSPTTSTVRSGVLASWRIDAGAPLGAGLSFAIDPVGAPGLVVDAIAGPTAGSDGVSFYGTIGTGGP